MSWVADVLDKLGVTGRDPTSFPDGAAFRIEIPSVEGPRVLEAVLRAAESRGRHGQPGLPGQRRVLLRAASCATWPRPGWTRASRSACSSGRGSGTGSARTPGPPDGRAHGDQVRGLRQLSYALEDVLRATEEGIRSFLVADLGLLRAVTQAQAQGALPAGLVWKVSAAMSPSNPVTVKLLEDLGASTVNIPADVTLAELAEMRAAVSLPLDLYVESPDPLGGVVRGQELGDLVRTGAPLYAKFGLRNAQAIYPSGHHLEAVACANAVEKVHRAAVALEWLERLSPGLVQSKPGAAGLGVPVRPEPVIGRS